MASFNSVPLGGNDIATYFQAPFTGSTNTTFSDYQVNGVSASYVNFSVGTLLPNSGYTSITLSGADISTALQPLAGEHLYTTNPTNTTTNYTFTVPTNVTSICIVCVGGAGGTTTSKNAAANSSWFGGSSTTPVVSGSTVICFAGGGSGTGQGSGDGLTFNGTSITQATGNVNYAGGVGTGGPYNSGGGAGGYAGAGGAGSGATGIAGTGGAGGGGSTNMGGGGVDIYGQGTSGAAGGKGGSGGTNGAVSTTQAGGSYGGGCGGGVGAGGGGALSYVNNYTVTPGATYAVHIGQGGKVVGGAGGPGGAGAVRIIWGNGRSFPATQLSTAFNQTIN